MIPEAEMQDRFYRAMQRAFETWAPKSQMFHLRSMGGFSGAAVYLVDVSPPSGGRGGGLEGNLIVKVYEHGPWNLGPDMEQERHRVAYELATDFSKAHVPRLLRSLRYQEEDEFAGLSVLLYEVAGPSLSQTLTLSEADAGILKRMCSRLSYDLLASWADREIQPQASSYHLLDQWLGYRLRPADAPELHAFIEGEMGGRSDTTIAGTAVVNPLALCRFEQSIEQSDDDDVANTWVRGMMHGDLHSGNVLVSSRLSPTSGYWLIDLALSQSAPVGYDHGYLEMALIYFLLQSGNEEQLLGVLRSLDDPTGEDRALPAHQGLVECLRAIRASVERWCQKKHPRRPDALIRQFLLGRVAAGISWANKPLETHEKQIALAYAAWAARLYVERFRDERFRDGRWPAELAVPRTEQVEEDRQKSGLWLELWNELDKFNDPLARYVLIADPLGDDADLSCLGQLPWSLIIDFDFQSEDAGLYCHAAPVLETLRALQVFSHVPVLPDFERGTAWMMARGWTRASEPIPDHRTWRVTHRSVLRQVFQQFFKAIDPNHIRVVLLTNRSHTADADYEERLYLTVDVVAETCSRIDLLTGEPQAEAEARIYQIGGEPRTYTQSVRHVPLTARDVVAQIRDTYGTTSHRKDPSMPAAGGVLKEIPIETLRLLEQGFDLLHSNILHDADPTHGTEHSSFRRGGPPDWHDLNNSNDVQRQAQKQLVEKLEKHLKENRNYTVQMFHMPGSGGTTLALRAAWNLRERYPTVILRNRTPGMALHLERLFYTLQRPILLIADTSVLSDSAREALYRELASKNCRVVTLYIRRSVKSDAGKSDDPDHPRSVHLVDPLDAGESRKFFKVFSELTGDDDRKEEIQRITERPELEQYRIPFFYGLVTYDKEFNNVDRFVRVHLIHARRRVRQVVEYLALITRFSKTGMHEVLLRRLLGATDTFEMKLEELMGEAPCRMLVQDGYRLKLMHPRIAEEVLRKRPTQAEDDEAGGAEDLWIDDLPDLAADFIRDVVRVGGNESDEVLGLFTQLFIHREMQVLEETESRNLFAEIIEVLDEKDPLLGQKVLEELRDGCRGEAHFWNHLGRHLIYRVERDYEDAERCLVQATILSPKDHVHHHTLGMVRRFWVERMIRGLKDPTAEDILYRIDDKYGDAIEALANGRKLNRQDDYSYITQIQLILKVALEMKKAAGAEHLGALQESSHEVAAWIEENIPEAERLLEAAKRTYGHLELQKADYVTRCTADLKNLYGKLDQVITVWELSLRRGASSPQARRSLALAYLARRGRNWTLLSEGECERIVFLMEENLHRGNPRPTDYWLWFQAYRQTRRFNYHDALRRLYLWKERSEVGQPHYYIYILNFLLWFHRDPELSEEFHQAREQSSKLAIGRRTRSFEWLGKDVAKCPLVFEDVLTWNDEDRFWQDTSFLRRVNGVILDMPGPQSGRIRIDGRVDVFFVPGKQFSQHADENKKVNFFLGFSYDGPRAWQVAEGWVEEGRRHHAVTTPINRQQMARSFLRDNPTYEQFALRTVKAAKKKLVLERIQSFALGYIQAAAIQERHVELSDIAAKIESVHNFSASRSEFGFDSIEALLESFPGVRVDDSDGRRLVTSKESRRNPALRPLPAGKPRRASFVQHFERRAGYGFIFNFEGDDDYHFTLDEVHGVDRGKIHQGVWVEFHASRGKETKAHKIGLRQEKDRFRPRIEDPDLTERVRRALSEIFFEHGEVPEGGGGHASVALSQAAAGLEQCWPDERPVFEQLGYPGLPEMLLGLDFELSRGKPVRLMEASAKRPGLYSFNSSRPAATAVGAAASDTGGSGSGQARAEVLDLDEARQRIRRILTAELKGRKEVPLAQVGNRLRQVFQKHLPAGKNVHTLFGEGTMTRFLNSFSGFTTINRENTACLRQERVKAHGRTGGGAQQIREPDPEDLRRQVRELVERHIDRAGGTADLVRVGEAMHRKLDPQLPPGKSLYELLQVKKLSELLRSLGGYETTAQGGKATVSRKTGSAEAPVPSSSIRQRARAIVDREVAAAGSDGVELGKLGNKLRHGLADVVVGSEILPRLGSKTLSAYLKTLDGLEVFGPDGPDFVRSATAEPPPAQGDSAGSPPDEEQDELHQLLREAALGSIPHDIFGIHVSAMANGLRQRFEEAGRDWDAARKSLGLEKGLDLVELIPELSVFKIGTIAILVPNERLESAQSLYQQILTRVGDLFAETDNLPFAAVEEGLASGLHPELTPPSRSVVELYGFKTMAVFLKALDDFSPYQAEGRWLLLRSDIPPEKLEQRREELNAASLAVQAMTAAEPALEGAMTRRFRALVRHAAEDAILDYALLSQARGRDASLATVSEDLAQQFLGTADLLSLAGFTTLAEMCGNLASVLLLGDEPDAVVMPHPSQMKILKTRQDPEFFRNRIERYLMGVAAADSLARRSSLPATVMARVAQRFPTGDGFWSSADSSSVQGIIEGSDLLLVDDESALRLVSF